MGSVPPCFSGEGQTRCLIGCVQATHVPFIRRSIRCISYWSLLSVLRAPILGHRRASAVYGNCPGYRLTALTLTNDLAGLLERRDLRGGHSHALEALVNCCLADAENDGQLRPGR